MYIHGFEGSWINHPFWRSRFLLTTDADLEKIRVANVPAVLIDDERGKGPDPMPSAPRAEPAAPIATKAASPRRSNPAMPPPRVPDDKQAAVAVMTRSKKVMKHIFDGARLGKAVRSEAVLAVVDEISTSVLRNPHALIGVSRLKSKHEYTYLHSVAVCALMINLARELGLAEERVRDLGLAGLLHDIGKMGVAETILDKPGRLSDEEFAEVRSHPEHGHRLLQQGDEVPAAALDVCLHHHEKLDGTGYPFGHAGEAISLEARMGAICDVYDALTSNRAYKQAWTPAEAITAMQGWSGHFDPELLFRFMQSIAVFPPEALVRLRSNRLGLVLPPRRGATVPLVRAFYSTVDREMLPAEDVLISTSLSSDQIVSIEEPDAWGLLGWQGLRESVMNAKVGR